MFSPKFDVTATPPTAQDLRAAQFCLIQAAAWGLALVGVALYFGLSYGPPASAGVALVVAGILSALAGLAQLSETLIMLSRLGEPDRASLHGASQRTSQGAAYYQAVIAQGRPFVCGDHYAIMHVAENVSARLACPQ